MNTPVTKPLQAPTLSCKVSLGLLAMLMLLGPLQAQKATIGGKAKNIRGQDVNGRAVELFSQGGDYIIIRQLTSFKYSKFQMDDFLGNPATIGYDLQRDMDQVSTTERKASVSISFVRVWDWGRNEAEYRDMSADIRAHSTGVVDIILPNLDPRHGNQSYLNEWRYFQEIEKFYDNESYGTAWLFDEDFIVLAEGNVSDLLEKIEEIEMGPNERIASAPPLEADKEPSAGAGLSPSATVAAEPARLEEVSEESYEDKVVRLNGYIEEGKYEESLGVLSEMIEMRPSAELYTLLGSITQEVGKWEQYSDALTQGFVFEVTEKAFNSALDLDPSYYDAHFGLGALYYNLVAEELQDAESMTDSEYSEAVENVREYALEAQRSFRRASAVRPEAQDVKEYLQILESILD